MISTRRHLTYGPVLAPHGDVRGGSDEDLT